MTRSYRKAPMSEVTAPVVFPPSEWRMVSEGLPENDDDPAVRWSDRFYVQDSEYGSIWLVQRLAGEWCSLNDDRLMLPIAAWTPAHAPEPPRWG